jgi:predicted Fe-Mo cluster-binding NifX family protein
MKIAIQLFGKRISPRFGVAPRMGLYSIERGKIANYKRYYVKKDGMG